VERISICNLEEVVLARVYPVLHPWTFLRSGAASRSRVFNETGRNQRIRPLEAPRPLFSCMLCAKIQTYLEITYPLLVMSCQTTNVGESRGDHLVPA
jgi:hypothetical protein